jgi:chaperonin GroEL
MIEGGTKPMVLKRQFESIRDSILEKSLTYKKDVTEEDWYKIAMISSSGSEEIAKNTVEIIGTAGVDGMVFINESKNQKTKIVKDSGYLLEEAMFDPVMGNAAPGRADYTKPHVFITDKKLYHVEECREILEQAYNSGVKDLVIVARDFIGESAGFLIANHMDEKVPLNILLIKYTVPDNNFIAMYDLATYLGANLVSEKVGSLKGKITPDHFCLVERVYSMGPKTIFVTENKSNPELSFLIEEVRQKKAETPEDNAINKRLASLTAGTVTIEVGATTGPELRELIYRYEDAINATRASIRSGYVVGGGLTLFATTRGLDDLGKDFGTASIKQIADNCGERFKEDKYTDTVGYNAKSGEYSDLEQDGVIEPYDVFKYSVINSFSIAIAILTSGYMIVNKVKKDKD